MTEEDWGCYEPTTGGDSAEMYFANEVLAIERLRKDIEHWNKDKYKNKDLATFLVNRGWWK